MRSFTVTTLLLALITSPGAGAQPAVPDVGPPAGPAPDAGGGR